MISTSCIAGGCIDVESPVSLKALKLHRWAEADKEFLRNLTMNNKQLESTETIRPSSESSSSTCSPAQMSPKKFHDQIQRQRYLRSYRFSKKETAAQRTKNYLMKEKQKLKNKMNGNKKSSGSNFGGSSCSLIDAIFAFFFMSSVKVDVHES